MLAMASWLYVPAALRMGHVRHMILGAEGTNMAEDFRAYRKTLATLRAQFAEVELRREKILAAMSAIEDLLGDKRAFPSPQLVGRTVRVPDAAKPATVVDAAEMVLREAGRPLHIKEIIARIRDAGHFTDKNEKVMRSSLISRLDRNSSNGRVFTKPAPATYGLLPSRTEGEMPSGARY